MPAKSASGGTAKIQCPGARGCETFARDFPRSAGANFAEKANNVCAACPKCAGNIPDDETDSPAAADYDGGDGVAELVETMADFAAWRRAGFPIDWTEYPFDYQQLFVFWTETERQIEEIARARMQIFLKGWMNGGKK